MSLLSEQIHEYMLSKAPPVPQVQPSDDHSAEAQSDQGNSSAEEPPRDAGDRVIEEAQEPPANPNPVLERAEPSRHSPTRSEQIQTRVQKPADDRLFTWAAVGLSIAIMVLLFKKIMKSIGHGAVFMDES